MPTIYCIGGVSGAGKSHLRRRNPALARLALFDIADVYDEYGPLHRDEARGIWMDRIEKQLSMFPGESIVAEAFFAPGKLQRQEIDELAHMYRFDVW